MNQSLEKFMSLFAFDPSKARRVGVERECFLRDAATGRLSPRADEVLAIFAATGDECQCSFEPSRCQVEIKTKPCFTEDLRHELAALNTRLCDAARAAGLEVSWETVAPPGMPLDLYPDPEGRYQKIFAHMPEEMRFAAFRVIATNVHVGMPDHETALRVYNRLIENLRCLMRLGDTSNGERLSIYQGFARDWKPVPFSNWGEFHRYAIERGFAENPRDWWALIRISRHGTIELRTLDASPSIDEVVTWARTFHAMCIGSM